MADKNKQKQTPYFDNYLKKHRQGEEMKENKSQNNRNNNGNNFPASSDFPADFFSEISNYQDNSQSEYTGNSNQNKSVSSPVNKTNKLNFTRDKEKSISDEVSEIKLDSFLFAGNKPKKPTPEKQKPVRPEQPKPVTEKKKAPVFSAENISKETPVMNNNNYSKKYNKELENNMDFNDSDDYDADIVERYLEKDKFAGRETDNVEKGKSTNTNILEEAARNEKILQKQQEEQEAKDYQIIQAISSEEGYKELSQLMKGNDHNVAACYSILHQGIEGFRAFFVGEESGSLLYAKEGIGNLLYRLGKIHSPKAKRLVFSELENLERWDNKTLYIIYDLKDAIINLFVSKGDADTSTVQIRYQNMLEKLLAAPANSFIILECDSTDYIGFNSIDSRIRYKFDKKCEFEDLSNEEIAGNILKNIENKPNVPNLSELTRFVETNRRFYPFKNIALANYISEYFILNGKMPEDKFNSFSLEDAFANIIGMENIRNSLKGLARLIQSRNYLKEVGMDPNAIPLRASVILTGPAGSGKTTVARIIAHLYFDMGVLPEDKLIEITASDLVSGEPGVTERKTNKIIQQAMGGALFLDECYSLADSGSAGLSALAILIKAMEDYRDRFVCIFAGYKKEVNEKFLPMNSGLDSRCTTYDLVPYTEKELFQIYMLKLRNIGVKLNSQQANQIERKLRPSLEYATRSETRGSGRFVERVVQGTMVNHARYLEENPTANKLIVDVSSIPPIEDVMSMYK